MTAYRSKKIYIKGVKYYMKKHNFVNKNSLLFRVVYLYAIS